MFSGPIKKVCFAALLFACSLISTAQIAYRNFSSEAGLPSNEMYCAFQDHAGYMWFGSDHGVVRYNGYTFKTFTTADGLTDNTVFSIKEDKEGLLWFLTFKGGICYYDGNRFYAHPLNDSITRICTQQVPTSWEPTGNKTLWLGSIRYGFYKFMPNGVKAFERINTKVRRDSIDIYVVHLHDSKYVYTSSFEGVLPSLNDPDIINSTQFTLSVNDFLNLTLNFSYLELPNKRQIITIGKSLLYLHNGKVKDKYVWPEGILIIGVRKANDGRIWMVDRHAPACMVKVEDDKIVFADSLNFNRNISDICYDKQGNYWFTSLENGLFMSPARNVRIFDVPELPEDTKILFLAANKENLYASLPSGKLLKVDKNMSHKILSPPSNVASVTSIIFKGDKIITNLDISGYWTSRSFEITFAGKVFYINGDTLFMGGQHGFQVVKDNQILFVSAKINFMNRVLSTCEMGNQRFALGTLNGLYYLDAHHPNYTVTNEPVLGNIRVSASVRHNENVYAFGTRGKGAFLRIKNKFHTITEKDGLISDLIEDIYFENDSTLWVATFKGLSKVYYHLSNDSLHTRIYCYTKEDGLSSDQINSITGFNGNIWLGTNEGLSYFKPSDLTEATLSIPLYIGNIYVNGIVTPPNKLDLNYSENNLLVEFNAIYYKALSGVRYKVRLNGTGGWKYTTQNFIQYFSLAAGEYRLEVMAEDKYGKYRSEVRTVNFVIHPRFIDTTWFKALIVLLIMGVILTIVVLIFNFQRLKAQNVIKLLQAEFKALNYQINPHFIFNVLNSIQYYILRRDTDNAVFLLSSFSMLIRKIVNNSKQQYVSVLEEIECLREYLELEKMRLDNKMDYEINIDSDIDLEEKIMLPMILQPLVENSIWHGIVPSNRHGKITVDFKKKDGQLLCIVEDNGVGIDSNKPNKPKGHNNLSLAMKNVSERLKITSELNDSTWEVKMEDKRNLAAPETGTRVTVLFPMIKTG